MSESALSREPVDARRAALVPAPGTVAPGSFAFDASGTRLTYLKPEKAGEGRVLWSVDCQGGAPRVVARPPGEGDTDRNVSQAEALRRERMRLRETGITQIQRAAAADLAVIPLGGDLYLLRGEGPLERITHTTSPEIDPQLTRDGKLVAFVRDGALHVLDLGSRQERRLTPEADAGMTSGLAEFIAQEEMSRFSGFWWSPDGARLAYQETDERHVPLFTITHDGSDAWSAETHRYPFAGAANARVRLGVIAASGGETTWLKVPNPDADEYLARVSWASSDRLWVQVLSRDQKTLKLYRVDATTGEETLLLDETAVTWINLHDALKPIGDTGQFLWASERTGFRHIELRDRDGSPLRTLTTGHWAVDEVLGIDAARREVWFSASPDDPRQLHAFRVSLDGGAPVRVTTEPGTHIVTVARDGNHFVDVASSLTQPPMTTLRDRSGQIVATLDDASADPRLSPGQIVPPVLTEFKNRDGVTLFGAYYAPRASRPGVRVPLVVMVYGGPHVQRVANRWDVSADMTAQMLADAGFAVWKADNRGASRRGHDFEAVIHRDMGSVEVRDQVDGVRFIGTSWPEVDTTRVGITGGSYGGYMTLRALELAPEVFRAGVAVAPVTDWDGYDTCYTERYMGTPQNNPDGYRRASVLRNAEALRGDLLIVHGMLDENVHFRHSARLANALIAAEKPFEWLPVPDARHSSRKESDRVYVAERTLRFFTKHLAPIR